MLARVLAAVLLSGFLVGCGSDSPGTGSETGEPSDPSATTTAATGSEDVVGEWQRMTTCRQRVEALKAAGLSEFAAEHAAGEGWIPGVSDVDQLEDPKEPCLGAVPVKHGHFFTADGRFGSRDAEGEQVDDGTYELTDEQTLVVTKEFGEVTFRFEVRDDRLYLNPVLPECAKDGCFAAQWAVAVAYPGLPWKRTG